MTTLRLDVLNDRIKTHKNVSVHAVRPPVCIEHVQYYTGIYQQHLDKPIPIRRTLALAHHLVSRTIWIKYNELIIGNRAGKVRTMSILPGCTISWIKKEVNGLTDRPGAGFVVSREGKRVLHKVCP